MESADKVVYHVSVSDMILTFEMMLRNRAYILSLQR